MKAKEEVIIVDKINEVLWEAKAITRSESLGDRDFFIVISNAYLYTCDNNLIYKKDNSLINIAKQLNEGISSEVIERLFNLFSKLNIDGIRMLISEILSGKSNSSNSFIETSNNYISELACELLEIANSGETVLDLGSGTGNFLANVYKTIGNLSLESSKLIGIEINAEIANISNMALSILGDINTSHEIITGNAFDKIEYIYSKGYVFPPLGMRKILEDGVRKSHLFPHLNLTNRNTGEWLFIDSLLSGLSKNNGRAIALVSGKSLFNNSDLEYRDELIKSGLLEGIIELPTGSLTFSGVKVFMLVFSQGNTSVKFVDASNIVNAENKRYVNFELPVQLIKAMYYSNEVKSKPNSELLSVTNLMPSTITVDVQKLENGVQLKDVAEVFIGNQYTLGVFENKGMLTDKKTGYRILTSSDIEDGVVSWSNLQSIDYKDTKFDKFAVKYGDVVVTSKSSKVKTVVVDIEPKEKILVTGGMLIVRPDQEKLNPTYLKMFLDSKDGQAAIKSIQKGVSIVTLNASGLETIEIPLIDIKKQGSKADRYNIELSTLIAYKNEIKRIENSLENILSDNEED